MYIPQMIVHKECPVLAASPSEVLTTNNTPASYYSAHVLADNELQRLRIEVKSTRSRTSVLQNCDIRKECAICALIE
jgi:hypothetical protein